VTPVSRLNALLDRSLSIFTAIAVVLMMAHIVVHALSRFLFNAPIFGTNEIVAFWYLPFVALLGIPAAQLQKEHITVSLLSDRLAPLPQAIMKIFGYALGALVSVGFAWFGLKEALKRMDMGATAGVTDIIAWPVYFLVPVVFAMLAALFVVDIIITARTRNPEVNPLTGETAERDIEETII